MRKRRVDVFEVVDRVNAVAGLAPSPKTTEFKTRHMICVRRIKGALTKQEKRIRVNPLARVRVDEVKEFRLGQFRPVEANEREKRSTTRAEAEYKIALIFYDSAVKEAHFTISLGMGKIK
ncbi:hypothetical protein TanjilG_23902 [Lupinus angustifolius]|uniref:Uncharacterized protein n=1 Tax=Lupinus angustifolius TaxID=3871 RepID=A0A1J7HWM6_LUPAN|nr:hypothetical protein TanjilG_23902 [Lupinus angustifolius]